MAVNKDEAYREYEETLARITKQAHEVIEEARTKLRGQLNTLRGKAHEELKSIHILGQRTKRRK